MELSLLDRSKYEDKRFVKVDKARRISPRWQKVKSLDQTASVVMDILNADMEGMPNIQSFDLLNAVKNGDVPAGNEWDRKIKLMGQLKQNMDIALKALDVAHVLNREAPENPFHIFHNYCYGFFKDIYDLAYVKGDLAHAHDKQKHFNIEEILTVACAAHSERIAEHPKVHSYKRNISHRPRKGVLEIIVPQERTGRILGFSMVVTPQEESEANKVCADLVKHIEQIPDVTVETHAILAPGISEQHVPYERLFTINGRLFFDTFMGLALKAEALDRDYKNQILAERQMHNKQRTAEAAR